MVYPVTAMSTFVVCAYLPPVKYRDRCLLAPTHRQESLWEQATIPTRLSYEHQWGPNYRLGLGRPSNYPWTGSPVTSNNTTLWPIECATYTP